MDKRIEKIYSRKKFKLPNIDLLMTDNLKKDKKSILQKPFKNSEKINTLRKIIKILAILIIAFTVVRMVINAIEPIIHSECLNIAKSIATIISNEQATKVMSKYTYEDLTNISRDENGNIKMISTNIITVNEIISDIPILMQEELNKEENSKFYIRLGSFTGSKILSGRGPNVEIKMSVNRKCRNRFKVRV